jgi:hypothetical protein
VHDRLRVHPDVDPVDGTPKSRCASIDLEALVDQGGRVRRDERPMRQVGWASACPGVTSAELLARRGRGTGRRWR